MFPECSSLFFCDCCGWETRVCWMLSEWKQRTNVRWHFDLWHNYEREWLHNRSQEGVGWRLSWSDSTVPVRRTSSRTWSQRRRLMLEADVFILRRNIKPFTDVGLSDVKTPDRKFSFFTSTPVSFISSLLWQKFHWVPLRLETETWGTCLSTNSSANANCTSLLWLQVCRWLLLTVGVSRALSPRLKKILNKWVRTDLAAENIPAADTP